MKYFLIETETRNPVTQMFNLNLEIDVKNINREKADKIAEYTLVEMRSREEIFFPEILSTPFFIVTKECMEVINMYMNHIHYKCLKLYSKSKLSKTYYLPILEEVNCLEEESEFNLNRSLIIKMLLNREAIGERALFRIAGFVKSYVIIRMDLAESILRRDAFGLRLTEIEVRSSKGQK